MNNKISLMNIEEAIKLPSVIDRRNKFKRIIRTSVENYQKLFSNCMMISGKPGSGKTTLIVSYLDKLKELGVIANYIRASGHITPRSLYNLLYDTASIDKETKLPNILVLDDVDCLKDPGCLELMKSAFDTKSNLATNRQVYYLSEGRKSTFRYNGFGIIVTNDNFLNTENNVHLDALLDRVQPVSCDLKQEDMKIYTTHLIEDYLNTNEDGLSDDDINSVVDFFNTDIRKWMENDCFQIAKVAYSLRLIKKFIDCQKLYGNDWKLFSLPYQKLEAAYEVATSNSDTSNIDVDAPAKPKKKALLVKRNSASQSSKTVTVKRRDGRIDEVEIPATDSNGVFIKTNGQPYNEKRQIWYKRQLEKAI